MALITAQNKPSAVTATTDRTQDVEVLSQHARKVGHPCKSPDGRQSYRVIILIVVFLVLKREIREGKTIIGE